MIKYLIQTLTLLFLLLSSTSIAYTQTQSTKEYIFSSEDVKGIAYAIESRKILMKDTAAYKQKINTLNLQISTFKEINARLDSLNNNSSSYILSLENDVEELSNERVVLIKDINKLNKKNKLLKRALPIGVVIGAGVVLLLK